MLTLDRPPLAVFDQEEFNRRLADLLRLDAALAGTMATGHDGRS
jgi:hypothetical protein